MHERISALAEHYQPGRYGSPGSTGVTIELVPDLHLWQLAAWPATADMVEADALKSVGAPASAVPGKLPVNYSVTGQHGVLLRVEPLKWWLLDATPATPDPETGTVVDLSHSRTRLRIGGDSAGLLLNRYIPVDLRPRHRRENIIAATGSTTSEESEARVISTAIHHIGVTLRQTENEFELFIPRGFSVSVLELLCLGAAQFGVELR